MRKYICCLLNLLCFCSFSFAQSLFLNPSIENKLILHSESMDKLIFSNSIGSIDTIKKIQIDSSTYFSEIQQNGYRFSNHIGEPKLPIKVQLIEIPQGATIKIHILSQEYQDISLDKVRHPFPIIPVQNPINKGFKQAPPFALNEKIYKSKKFLPKTLVSVQELGEMRASRLAHLIISPFCYNPQKNILRVYTQLSFEIIFEGAQFEKTIEKKQIYQTERSYNVGNWCLNQLPSSTLSTHKFPSQALKYVIVADSIFKNDLQEFIAWKRQQGYAIIEAYTSNPLVGKSCESIHAYLKKLYTEATPYQAPPSYILLVGDIAQIPAFPSKLPDMPSCYTKDHISDLYYAEYTGDYLPDVFYGRFSANTVEELRPQIEKTLAMEQLRIPSQNFMDTSMLIAGYDKTYGNSHLNTQINYIEQYYINAQEGICPFKFLFPESKNQKEKILQVFSKGVNLISYTGHGSETSWANIELTTQDIDALSNHNKYPFVLGNCCLTGKFNFGECFAEALLRADKKGAVAYIGASNNSFFDEDLYWTIGFGDIETSTLTYENTSLGMFDKLFHTHGEPPDKWALSLGEILTQGNLSVMESNSILQNYYWEIYHIFGDPSYMPYKKKPSLPKAIYSKHIVKGETLFNVQTEAFAYVALSDSNTLYGACTADANGIAEIKISTLPQKDSIQLHIQAQFCSPYTASIRLEQPSQAYVIVDSIQILNSQGSMATSGEYNKSYTLQIQLHNLGRTDAQFCTCKLRSPHPSVHIVDTAFLNVPIVPNGTYLLSQKLAFHLDANSKDQELIDFYIDIETNGQNHSLYKFSYFINAPQLHFVQFTIDDYNSQKHNRQLDIDENVKGILQFKNTGHASARNCKVQIQTPNSFIIVSETQWLSIGDIAPEETKTIQFALASTHDAKAGEEYQLHYIFDSDSRENSLESTGVICAIIEDFEDSNFTLQPWIIAKSDWIICQDTTYEGRFCASSQTINDNDSSSLEITLEVPKNDSIHFYFKVDNEMPNGRFGDFLNFYINDQKIQFYGGNIPWQKASFPVMAGSNTFRWTYQKDESISFASDKAWLDWIVFPKGARSVNIESLTQKNENESDFTVWQKNEDEIELIFLTDTPYKGNIYLVNLLGQKVGTLATNVTIKAQEKNIFTYSINKLPKSFYICIFEGIDSHNSFSLFSKKILLNH